jgi:hypothetical protein
MDSAVTQAEPSADRTMTNKTVGPNWLGMPFTRSPTAPPSGRAQSSTAAAPAPRPADIVDTIHSLASRPTHGDALSGRKIRSLSSSAPDFRSPTSSKRSSRARVFSPRTASPETPPTAGHQPDLAHHPPHHAHPSPATPNTQADAPSLPAPTTLFPAWPSAVTPFGLPAPGSRRYLRHHPRVCPKILAAPSTPALTPRLTHGTIQGIMSYLSLPPSPLPRFAPLPFFTPCTNEPKAPVARKPHERIRPGTREPNGTERRENPRTNPGVRACRTIRCRPRRRGRPSLDDGPRLAS